MIPVQVVSENGASSGLTCKALWKVKDSTGFTYEALKIEETGNGPYMIQEHSTRNRDNFYSGERIARADDKYYLNWDSDYADRTWRNGEGFDF